MKVAIIGTGAIGGEVAKAAAGMEGVSGLLLFDIVDEAARRVAAAVPKAKVVGSLVEAIRGADIVVEAATVEAARDIVPRALGLGRQVLMMSIGALVDDAFFREMRGLARAHGAKLFLPSGAIAGVDGLKAGALAALKSVTLVTSKPPAALGVDVDKWTVLFSGTAREAIKRFPRNINVAVCLSIAGLGADETRVEVVADPLATHNEHKLIVEGDFGRMRLELKNLPHPDNPKTSYLASLSAIATLRRILDPVQIGA